MNEEPSGAPPFRCGYVTIAVAPNVGKSTLMNRLLGQKIAIVTHKPQTTRHKILGILSAPAYQVVFLDTPGIIKPRYLLQEVMMRSAHSAVADADLLLFMVDAMDPQIDTDLAHADAFKTLEGLQKPVWLVLNKVDRVKKDALLPMIDHFSKKFRFAEIFPVSALTGLGIQDLLASVVKMLPEHPPFYPTDIVSEHDDRFFVGEIISEKVFLKCEEEIPYSTTVGIVEFRESGGGAAAEGEAGAKAGKWLIRAEIYVERDSQKGILIGKNGAMLKEIGRVARQEIERFLNHPVFLDLHVKVQEKWRSDEQWLQRMGYKG